MHQRADDQTQPVVLQPILPQDEGVYVVDSRQPLFVQAGVSNVETPKECVMLTANGQRSHLGQVLSSGRAEIVAAQVQDKVVDSVVACWQ